MLQWYMCKYQVGIDPCIEGCDTSWVGYRIPCPCTLADTLVEIRYPKTLVSIHLALESLRPRHTANVKSRSPRHEPEMGKPFENCYWFINFLEVGTVDSPHHTLTPPSFFHIRCFPHLKQTLFTILHSAPNYEFQTSHLILMQDK